MIFVRLLVRLWSSWYVYGVMFNKYWYIYIFVYFLYKNGLRRMVFVWYLWVKYIGFFDIV